MLLRLYHKSGVYKNAFLNEAKRLLALGSWYDITKYKSIEEKENVKSILLHEENNRDESGHQRCRQRVQQDLCSERPSAEEGRESSGSDVCGRSDLSQNAKEEVITAPPKKRRGRPPKIKVSNNATDKSDHK